MNQDYSPITPPPELIQQWWDGTHGAFYEFEAVAIQAVRWGYQQCMKLDTAWLEAKLQEARDEELKACCDWLNFHSAAAYASDLRTARRPKRPKLKEQALALINHDPENQPFLSEEGIATIRRALESLPS